MSTARFQPPPMEDWIASFKRMNLNVATIAMAELAWRMVQKHFDNLIGSDNETEQDATADLMATLRKIRCEVQDAASLCLLAERCPVPGLTKSPEFAGAQAVIRVYWERLEVILLQLAGKDVFRSNVIDFSERVAAIKGGDQA